MNECCAHYADSTAEIQCGQCPKQQYETQLFVSEQDRTAITHLHLFTSLMEKSIEAETLPLLT
ncbi:hypothetical protein GCM10007894_20370 [Paraferrimonas haliotis]|uniref:Uncharacterized protein n=1 Tax=Paraferrimonas haliotis TaxID=2013866 RepID=A0AA37TRS2_9GAMM|nr:hypothetical protein GCM10007894_20370 [Paraferrimonas haliotis]